MIERTDAVNWSSLKYMAVSPRHYRYALEHPREDTEALLRGRVIHTMIYEPDQLAARYVVMPRFHGGQNDSTALSNGYEGGKQAKASWLESAGQAEVVEAAIYEACIGMRDALLADPIAAPMIAGGFAEQLVTWTDELTGIECRGRVDHVNSVLSDLKSTRNIEPRAFGRDMARLMYPAQLAFYADGLEANGVMLDGPPAIIAVENVAPYDVLVVELSDADLAAGRRIYRKCLDTLHECRLTDQWPGVSGGMRTKAALPEWFVGNPVAEPITMGGVAIF